MYLGCVTRSFVACSFFMPFLQRNMTLRPRSREWQRSRQCGAACAVLC